MDFEWDTAKSRANVRKHGIAFSDAVRVFDGPMLVRLDDRHDDEDRWIALGDLDGRIVMVVYTERGDRVRLVSVRKATHRERETYLARTARD